MRSQRWAAAGMVSAALTIGILAGCGGSKSQEGASAPAVAPSTAATPAPSGTPAAGGTEVSLAAGDRIFKERCILCHGPEGKGNGPGGAALNPKPRNFTDHAYMSTRTDDQLSETIHNGKGAMPPWGKSGILSDADIKSAILKVRSLDPQHH